MSELRVNSIEKRDGNNVSLSENTPIIDTKLTGKVIGTILKNKYHSNI